MSFVTRISASLAALVIGVGAGLANPLEPGWTLNSEMSNLRFQSIKNTTKVESSSFATFKGQIDPSGSANIVIALDSVDTKIDLRNVRMRFLFFETFNFPDAVVTTQIDTSLLEQLATSRRITTSLPFSLDLHGVKKTFVADVVATLLTDDMVSVASAAPISVSVAEFGLMENLAKLQEAAGGVQIVPSATVSFDFIFGRNGGNAAPQVAAATQAPAPATPETTAAVAAPEAKDGSLVRTAVALETQGNFGREECSGRFETMTIARGVFFRSGSASIDGKSAGLLDTLADIVSRCPDLALEVGGHTDADGSESANQRLSERRASAVTRYLQDRGIDGGQLVAVGFGESQPVADNTTAEGKSRNRRIEFKILEDNG